MQLGGSAPQTPRSDSAHPGTDLTVFHKKLQNHAKKLDLAETIRMVQSRASGSPWVSRYGQKLFGIPFWSGRSGPFRSSRSSPFRSGRSGPFWSSGRSGSPGSVPASVSVRSLFSPPGPKACCKCRSVPVLVHPCNGSQVRRPERAYFSLPRHM